MSLINNVLRDLDARQSRAGGQPGLSGEIRSVGSSGRRVRPVFLFLLGVVIMGMAGWWGYACFDWRAFVLHPESPQTAVSAPVVPVVSRSAPASTAQSQVPSVTEGFLSLSLGLAEESVPVPDTKAAVSASPPVQMPSGGARKTVSSSTEHEPVSEAPRAAKPDMPTGPAQIRVERVSPAVLPERVPDLQRASDLMQAGNYADAEVLLRSVLERDRLQFSARLALASLYVRQQREEEARKLLKEGLDLAPNQPGLLLAYVRRLAAHNEWKAAADALAPAAPALGRDPEYHALYGAVWQRLGKFRESAEAYFLALRLNPAVAAWWVGLGVSLEADGRGGEALEAYQQALARNPGPDLQPFIRAKLGSLRP